MNCSLYTAVFPAAFETSVAKSNSDPTMVDNYRPGSNKSGFRKNYSTETEF